jgi:hypothetical protein
MTDILKTVKNRGKELSLILITMYMRAIFSIIRNTDMAFMNSMVENTKDSL